MFNHKDIELVSELERLNEDLTRFRDLRHRLMEARDADGDAVLLEAARGACDLRDAITGAVRSALEDEGAASRLRGRLDEMEARLRRLERRAEVKREMALRAMEEAGLGHLDAPGLRIVLRRSPPVLVVSDESLIPDAFRIERPSWLDYQAIRGALTAGAQVPGATLAEPQPYLSVRTT